MHQFNCLDLISVFNNLFEQSEKTILVANGLEPVYLPCDENYPFNRIVFTHDYFASALHEIAHWCIAGEERRKQTDYGYWYSPDGRDAEQQKIFEKVEIKPQALEWIFSQSAGYPFRVSLDNLSAGLDFDPKAFEANIMKQAQCYLAAGLPKRAEIFNQSLIAFYK